MAFFSIIIPVYNRPDELDELLDSLKGQLFHDFEIIVVEDGSDLGSKEVVSKYSNVLAIQYLYKENSGPGPSRNYGSEHSGGEYLIFLDSDCVVPPGYLQEIYHFIIKYRPDAFGGPDRAANSFTSVQKAINYSMTSVFTTGGIRGVKKSMERFKPRSFNMGISRKVYEATKGFAPLRFGEDIDLSLRIEALGFNTYLIEKGWVYHKRRTDFNKFFKQVFNSGVARIVLYKLHPGSLKLVHVLPSLFTLGMIIILLLSLVFKQVLYLILIFVTIIFADSFREHHQIKVAFYAIISSFVQLTGYGLGFFYGIWKVLILKTGSYFAFKEKFYE